VEEIMHLFNPKSGDILLDATLGQGGHSKEYLERSGPDSRVVGIDADESALVTAREVLAPYKDRVETIRTNFWQIKDSFVGGGILSSEGKSPLFNHILFDLGVGSHQLADTKRGFSFTQGTSLAMRYGEGDLPSSSIAEINELTRRLGVYPDAADLLTGLSVKGLTEVISTFGEERFAPRIAKAIHGVETTSAQELAELIAEAVPGQYRHGRINPATRTFQALRLAVNRELEVLQAALPQAVEFLAPEGKLAVISFHSLEDRIVKHFFKEQAMHCICPPQQPECICNHTPTLAILTKKPVTASEEEVKVNPRSRSAKLRVAQKIASP
jgi:16S rRNA (cytosine1402-N4)-methyltransferase